ncbi:hypothetical protein JCGZ_22773 [Jatropha curcas]|uniref:Uncharacterized protein n=1 Tax=Jatropha curcas TaxID=180498 RepID=A0A067L457_JATCU|nr:hypothetical protein JCGZ_22773 [Jatropha curcas]
MEVEPRSSRRMINIFITGLSPWVLTTSNICSFKAMSSGTVVVDKKGMSTMETQDMSNAIQILDPDAVMCIVGSGANCSNPYVVFSIDDVHHLDKKHPS